VLDAPRVARANGPDLRVELLELAAQQVMVGRLAGKAIPVVCWHLRNTSNGHEIPPTVHTGYLQACAALSGVFHLLTLRTFGLVMRP
jgi:hypothetical protein